MANFNHFEEYLTTGNYFELADQLKDQLGYYNNLSNMLSRMELPTIEQLKPLLTDYSLSRTLFRTYYTKQYGFALLNKEFIEKAAEAFRHLNVLEVMAGSGYLAYHLKMHGVDIIATDNHSWRNGRNDKYFAKDLYEIKDMDAVDAVEEYHEWANLVIMSWPPYDKSIGYLVAKACEKYKLQLLYIGEDYGGCTGDDDLHELIDQYKNYKFFTSKFTRFIGIYDFPRVIDFNEKVEENDE